MQKVSDDMGDGGMLAIMGMAYPEVKELTEACVKDGTVVCISTYNDIRQMVISGRKVHFLLFLVGAYPLYQPFTLQKSLGSLHRLAQKWHEIGIKDF